MYFKSTALSLLRTKFSFSSLSRGFPSQKRVQVTINSPGCKPCCPLPFLLSPAPRLTPDQPASPASLATRVPPFPPSFSLSILSSPGRSRSPFSYSWLPCHLPFCLSLAQPARVGGISARPRSLLIKNGGKAFSPFPSIRRGGRCLLCICWFPADITNFTHHRRGKGGVGSVVTSLGLASRSRLLSSPKTC